MTIKIEAMSGELPQPFEYGNVFVREEVGGLPRLCVGVDGSQDTALAALADVLLGRASARARHAGPHELHVEVQGLRGSVSVSLKNGLKSIA